MDSPADTTFFSLYGYDITQSPPQEYLTCKVLPRQDKGSVPSGQIFQNFRDNLYPQFRPCVWGQLLHYSGPKRVCPNEQILPNFRWTLCRGLCRGLCSDFGGNFWLALDKTVRRVRVGCPSGAHTYSVLETLQICQLHPSPVRAFHTSEYTTAVVWRQPLCHSSVDAERPAQASRYPHENSYRSPVQSSLKAGYRLAVDLRLYILRITGPLVTQSGGQVEPDLCSKTRVLLPADPSTDS
ncbi:hypothetical protein K470DRAFT_10273 [Piedraia hortae CBS 480.64]|uniref:Uncharacterized protein n=1 Tax=Piedraia hortae CBS 480.64 TaxID=1314780 RepID=A0A6A7C580_9PEZI|nr:hypothetical protein K470DRAFT_10273 [Piedraia hortae CBS 480.64]